ncbi:MAG: hypothetical protein HRU15_05785 [Planctomycetes bacterium]|nr:hypothetical protein [Planctomycetota bacterium]
MVKISSIVCILALMLCGMSVQTVDAADKKSVQMEGTFVWSHKPKKVWDITATITETAAKGEYDIKFNFDFGWSKDKMKPYVYTGTAKGSLAGGALTGDVNNGEKKLRTFTFDGKITDGKFTATHKETTKDRVGDTGTMKLTLKK